MTSISTPLHSLPVAIPTLSLGRAWVHNLEIKLIEAEKAGFKGIEVFYEDLEYLTKENSNFTETQILEAASFLRKCCDKSNIRVLCLQPFMNYDGLVDPEVHNTFITKLHLWFKIVKILGTDLIQVPTQFLGDGTTGDEDKIAADLAEIGDLGLKETPIVRFAYESVAWGYYKDTWQDSWRTVKRINRPNVGLCIDSFHILGRVWGDPTSSSGKTPNAEADLKDSLAELVREVPLDKIYYVQLSDAERLDPPLSPSHPFFDPEQKPRMSWSRKARLFPMEIERGGYLPILDFVHAMFIEKGYRGWVSMESFNRTMSDPSKTVPKEHAQRAMRSWKALLETIKTHGNLTSSSKGRSSNTKTILLLNGPNLNLLGTREPATYGSSTLSDVESKAIKQGEEGGVQVECFQSNHEGALIDRIHQARSEGIDAIVINPGGLTHTSVSLRDALVGTSIPFIEVHISNIHSRESFRHTSYLSSKASAIVVGMGIDGYTAAIDHILTIFKRGDSGTV